MTENEVKEAIVTRLHKRAGICGHCGKKKCAGKILTQLPARLNLEDVLWAISFDKPLPEGISGGD